MLDYRKLPSWLLKENSGHQHHRCQQDSASRLVLEWHWSVTTCPDFDTIDMLEDMEMGAAPEECCLKQHQCCQLFLETWFLFMWCSVLANGTHWNMQNIRHVKGSVNIADCCFRNFCTFAQILSFSQAVRTLFLSDYEWQYSSLWIYTLYMHVLGCWFNRRYLFPLL